MLDGDDAAGDRTPAAVARPASSGHPAVTGAGDDTAAIPDDSTVQQSIAGLRGASAADPRNADLLLKLGDAFVLGERYREAGRTFRSVLRLEPDNTAAAVRLAMVWHASGDSPRAIAALKDVVAATPEDQEAHYFLAIVYFSQQDVEHAEAEWTAAARLDPASPIGRRSKSFVDLLEGKQSSQPSADGGD